MFCLTINSPTPKLKLLNPFTPPPFHHLHLHVTNSHKKPKETSRVVHKPQPCMPFTRRMCSGNSSMVMEKEQEEKKVWALCGLSYWVQGFRCFPWLAFNFHMAHGLRISPSTLQLVQSCANLPLVAKPLFGVISDAVYIGGAHRIPYISFGGLCFFVCPLSLSLSLSLFMFFGLCFSLFFSCVFRFVWMKICKMCLLFFWQCVHGCIVLLAMNFLVKSQLWFNFRF